MSDPTPTPADELAITPAQQAEHIAEALHELANPGPGITNILGRCVADLAKILAAHLRAAQDAPAPVPTAPMSSADMIRKGVIEGAGRWRVDQDGVHFAYPSAAPAPAPVGDDVAAAKARLRRDATRAAAWWAHDLRTVLDALDRAEVQCPSCSATIRARMADAPPIAPTAPAGSEHYREGWRTGYEQARIDAIRAVEDAAPVDGGEDQALDEAARTVAEKFARCIELYARNGSVAIHPDDALRVIQPVRAHDARVHAAEMEAADRFAARLARTQDETTRELTRGAQLLHDAREALAEERTRSAQIMHDVARAVGGIDGTITPAVVAREVAQLRDSYDTAARYVTALEAEKVAVRNLVANALGETLPINRSTPDLVAAALAARAGQAPTGDLDRMVEALRLIAGDRCRRYTGTSRCTDVGSGKTRGAQYGADAWCDACIAVDGLRGAPSGGAERPAGSTAGTWWGVQRAGRTGVNWSVTEAMARHDLGLWPEGTASLVRQERWLGPVVVVPAAQPGADGGETS